MASPKTIKTCRESGTTVQEEPTISRRKRGGRKRNRNSSSSPTPSDTGDANSVATMPERNISKHATGDDQIITEMAIPDTPLLHNLAKHPSAYARAGQSVPTKNLNFRGAWPTALKLYREAHSKYKELFDVAGFKEFLSINAVHIPQAYAIALMERWFCETNTVHLPRCEIGPTPVDWTMITGLRFSGQCISVNPEYDQNKVLELLQAKPEAITEGKIRLSKIKPNVKQVKTNPRNDKRKEVIFRRLFLYVIGSCFFSNNRSVINRGLVQFVERIDEVGRYDWGSITFAAFLTGMRRKVTAEIGAFTGFWPFLAFWAFEYLDISRPKHAVENVFPRAIRWNCPQSHPGPLDLSEVVTSRCQLNYLEEDQVTWKPYLGSAEFGSGAMDSTRSLAKKRVPFRSVDTWEYYLGERCWRQLGLPCQIPHPPPENMHGSIVDIPEDEIGVGRSAGGLLMDEIEKYDQWFAKNSIGKVVDVTRFLGGPKIAGKVVEDLMARHQPDKKIISKSEYDELVAARAAAIPARVAVVAESSENRKDGRTMNDS